MRAVFVFLLLFLLAPLSQARRSTEWALHIDTKIEGRYFPDRYEDDVNNDNYRAELQPSYRWDYKDFLRFYLRPEYVADPGNLSESERNYFDFTEAYLRYKSDSFTLQAGNSLYTWGVTDGYNPLDVVNAKQYFDPLQTRKRGALSVLFSQSFESWDYELIYIPKNSDTILPGEKSRWLPREIYVPQTPDNDLVLVLPETLRYHFTERQNLNEAVDNNLAARMQWRGFVDLSLTYYEGVASFPLVKPVVTGTVTQVSPKTVIAVDPDVILNTQNYRLRHGGLSLVRSQWDILFKFATSYSQSLGDDSYLPGWIHENIAAIEKTFNIGSEGLLIAVLQHSFIASEKQNDSNLSATEIFRDAWMLGGRFSWGDLWTGSLMGLYENRHGSHYEEISLGRRLGDAWLLNASARFITGKSENPLGLYNKNSSYSLALSRSF